MTEIDDGGFAPRLDDRARVAEGLVDAYDVATLPTASIIVGLIFTVLVAASLVGIMYQAFFGVKTDLT